MWALTKLFKASHTFKEFCLIATLVTGVVTSDDAVEQLGKETQFWYIHVFLLHSSVHTLELQPIQTDKIALMSRSPFKLHWPNWGSQTGIKNKQLVCSFLLFTDHNFIHHGENTLRYWYLYYLFIWGVKKAWIVMLMLRAFTVHPLCQAMSRSI